VTDHDRPLEAVDCDIHSVRYNMVLERSVGGRLKSQMASSGHLRRCSDAGSDADMTKKSLSREKDASILSH
jgi:hypothetical protein